MVMVKVGRGGDANRLVRSSSSSSCRVRVVACRGDGAGGRGENVAPGRGRGGVRPTCVSQSIGIVCLF